MDKTKVLVVDDHAIVRMGMVALLNAQPNLEVVGEAKNGELGVRAANKLRPDDGPARPLEVAHRPPGRRGQVGDERADPRLVHPELAERELPDLGEARDHERAVTSEIEEIIASDEPAPNLTQHQLDMLASIVRGLTNADIALQFGISENTVRKATSTIFAKLGVANRTEATAMALRKGLVKL